MIYTHTLHDAHMIYIELFNIINYSCLPDNNIPGKVNIINIELFNIINYSCLPDTNILGKVNIINIELFHSINYFREFHKARY